MTIEGFECSKPKNKDYISGYDLRGLLVEELFQI